MTRAALWKPGEYSGLGLPLREQDVKLRSLGAVCTLLALLALSAPTTHSTDGPDDVQRTLLPSGLVVLTKERADPDSVAVNVAVRVGSRDEDAATNGAAHFMEHMFFQGTPRRPSALDVQRPDYLPRRHAERYDRVGVNQL